jgi:hypothetical protein
MHPRGIDDRQTGRAGVQVGASGAAAATDTPGPARLRAIAAAASSSGTSDGSSCATRTVRWPALASNEHLFG